MATQVLELARDCLQKSRQQLVTSRYFYEMSDNLERLVGDAKDKSADGCSKGRFAKRPRASMRPGLSQPYLTHSSNIGTMCFSTE